MNQLQKTPQEIELGNLRGEVEMLRHIVAELVSMDSGHLMTRAMSHARNSIGEHDGPNGQARIALEHAHNRFQELLR